MWTRTRWWRWMVRAAYGGLGYLLPNIARDAATVMLLRDRPEEMEVLMVQRHRDMKFMGGALVFPGGKHDPADANAASEENIVELLF